MRKILLIKLWAIGEVALSTPCISRLKKEFPDAEIYFLVGSRAKDIVVGNPDIKRVLEIDENIFLKPSLLKLFTLVRYLRHERFDTIITLHHSAIFSLFAFLIGAAKRIGLKRPGSWSLNTASIISDGATRSKIFEYLKTLELLTIRLTKQNVKVMIYPNSEDKKHVSWLMEENSLKIKEFVLLSPTGGENPAASRLKSNVVNKVWPLEYYRRLCHIILKNSNFKVILIGGEVERARADYIKSEFGERVIDLTGKTNLRELVLLGEASAIAVTNDSGPMHLLSAAHSPIIAIFGPTKPDLICPPSANVTIIREEINCSPCFDPSTLPNRVKDCKDPICMKRITPEKVFQKVCEIVNMDNKNL